MNYPARPPFASLLCVFAAAVVVSCGSSDDDNSSPPEATGHDASTDTSPGDDAQPDTASGSDAQPDTVVAEDASQGDAPGEAAQDAAAEAAAPIPNVFAMSVEVRAPSGTAQASYIQAIDRSRFNGGLITNDAAHEYEGIARLLTMGGKVYVGPRTEPTLVQFTVGDDLSLTQTNSVSFLNYGDGHVDIGFIPNISDTKAYYLAAATQKGVVINPQDLTIQGDFDISAAQRPGFEGASLHQGIIQFEHAVVGNRAFESTLSSTPNPAAYYPKMTVSVYDTSANTLLKVIEDDRCYGPSTMVKDDNGDVYVSSYSFTGRIYQATGYDYKPTCVLRIKAGEDEFDPSYFVSFPELLGGRECTRWFPVNGRYSYGVAIKLDDLKAATSTSNATGEIWKIDLVAKTASKVDGLPDTTPFITLGYPDSHDSLVLGVAAVAGAFDHSLVYRLEPATDTVTKVFEVNGLLRGFWPVR